MLDVVDGIARLPDPRWMAAARAQRDALAYLRRFRAGAPRGRLPLPAAPAGAGRGAPASAAAPAARRTGACGRPDPLAEVRDASGRRCLRRRRRAGGAPRRASSRCQRSCTTCTASRSSRSARTPQALIALRRAAYLDPASGFAQFLLAVVLGRLGHGAEAARAYGAAAQALARRVPHERATRAGRPPRRGPRRDVPAAGPQRARQSDSSPTRSSRGDAHARPCLSRRRRALSRAARRGTCRRPAARAAPPPRLAGRPVRRARRAGDTGRRLRNPSAGDR